MSSSDYFKALARNMDEATAQYAEGEYRRRARAWYSKGYADGYKQALEDQAKNSVPLGHRRRDKR